MNGIVRALICLLCALGFAVGVLADEAKAPTTTPATQPAVDPALWAKMVEIDGRADKIKTLVADFEQQKFTALLRKPLLSGGRVRVSKSELRWDTERPAGSRNVLLIGDKELRIYYPGQQTVEVYPIDQRVAQLAASPLPRLATLKDKFSFQQIAVPEMDKSADPARFLALRMLPSSDELKAHVREVRVLLDVPGGYIVQAEMTDADGDRTIQRFSKVQLNVDVGNLDLNLPPGTKVTHPLEGLPQSSQPPAHP